MNDVNNQTAIYEDDKNDQEQEPISEQIGDDLLFTYFDSLNTYNG
jgi:hypothetical protein